MQCDICGKKLIKTKLCYLTKIISYAAYDPIEITFKDLMHDYTPDIERLLAKIKKKKTKILEEEIVKTFTFNMCPACRKKYIRNPLGIKNLTKKSIFR